MVAHSARLETEFLGSSPVSRPLAQHFILLALILLGFWLRVHNLDAFSFWTDEGLTPERSGYPIAQILRNEIVIQGVVTTDTHPPLYYLIIHLTRQLFGLSDFAFRYPSVLVILSWLAQRDLGWIYLQRGRPRRWLPFGLVSLAVCAVVMVAMLLWAGMSAGDLLAAAPYILAFVTANAIMEELWFRGVFLRSYETTIGWTGAMVVTALAFGVSHMNATYFESAVGLVFGLGVIGLGVLMAWAMRWGNSLWGSVLFHMGMDLLIILPIVQSL